VDLRSDTSPTSLYYATKDARAAARAAERKIMPGETPDPANAPDWGPVLKNATKALTEKTKDLEITAYLIEALVRLHGFAGLRDGLRLAREFVERFWDNLYPTPDEEGVATRVAPLTGLNGDDSEGTLMDPLQRVPITDATSVGRCNVLNYHETVALQKITDPKAKEKRLQQGAVPPENFQKAVAESSPKYFQTLVGDLTQCSAQLAQLATALDKRCDQAAPPTSAIRTALEDCLAIVKDVGREKLAAAAAAETAAAPAKPQGDGAPVAGTAAPAAQAGAIKTREEALKFLAQVADFFRKTEPHTIVSYALDQVVRWGRMPLPDLLTELIPEEGPRKNLFKQVGIRLPEPPPKAAEPAKK
jgi:type VI secretion system protein ImpA